MSKNEQRSGIRLAGRAYILENQVTHVRYLPIASKHAFVYPIFSLLVSLKALEDGELNLLGGWLFGYGTIWNRVTGLRASAYLHDSGKDKRSIRDKLVDILNRHGQNGEDLDDSWLMTVPSFLGIEGINPLTVHFCYRRGNSKLWIVALEVHNTFGERHVYVLDCEKSVHPTTGFEYEWIFSRQFHVSPFNDRSGYYKCQIIAPPGPPSSGVLLSPRPIIKLTLLAETSSMDKKLVAIQRTTQSKPLSSSSLLYTLISSPLALVSALRRIFYQAYLLHYQKRLDVYQRPEPHAVEQLVESCLPPVPNRSLAESPRGGVGWQKKNSLERWCETRIYGYLQKRCHDTKIAIHFRLTNPAEELISIPEGEHTLSRELTIYYRSPRIFSLLFMMPSSQHSLLLGTQGEKVFSVSSSELFTELFVPPTSTSHPPSWKDRLAKRLRSSDIPHSITIPIPEHHALDSPPTLRSLFVLSTLIFLGVLERNLYLLFHARFVPGDEPWGGWNRITRGPSWDVVGSHRRDNER